MGCVNCKPNSRSLNASSNGSERSSCAQKSTEKRRRKSMRSFLRFILFASSRKSKSSSKITPEISSTQADSPSLNTTASHSAERLHEIFCRSASDSNVSFYEEERPAIENDPELEAIETKDVHSDCTSNSEEEVCKDAATEALEKITELRKERYKLRAIRSLEEVSTFKDELKSIERSQEEHVMEIKLLMALKTSALQSPQSAHRVSKLNASIKKLSKTYCQYEKELYTVKGKRAIGEAKVDYFLIKLNPELKYSDIYANNNSFYLNPIPEECDEQIVEE